MLIAQLTDFHVTAAGQKVGGEVDTRASFSALMAHVASLRPRPDLLLVSGDIAETGTQEEYTFARHGLEGLGIPFLAVPGNHDLRAPMRQVLAGHTGTEAGHLGLARAFADLRVIGLDTLVEGRGHGALAPAQLAWLKAVLDAGDGRPALVFMHHPPFTTGIAAMDAIGVREGASELRNLLEGRGDILAVLCGHVHRAISGIFAGHRAFIAPAAGHQFAFDPAGTGFRIVREPAQVALHTVVDGALLSYLVPGPRHPAPDEPSLHVLTARESRRPPPGHGR